MGYSLKDKLTIGCSDMAADFFLDLTGAMVPFLKKQENKESGFNTDGILNVAMVLNDFILATRVSGQVSSRLLDYVEKFITRFELYIKRISKESDDEWDGKANKEKHLKAYRKLLADLKRKERAMQDYWE